MERTQCPNCRSSASCHPFYEVRGVPTNSCLLVDDRGRALDFPTGDIMLAVCGECGFIFNAAWDPDRTIYSDQYEETQGFSPTFNAFNRTIAEELISGYDIRGKTVLEIGCGKGEFLSLICKLGGNRGIGYDPSFVPDRQRSEQDIRFVREFFTGETRETAPDLLCCKMTLEHIAQPHRFLVSVRTVADRQDSVIFFQVPDVRRILKEGAFWDIYYEHCSYFSSISLNRLFTDTGSAVRRIWTGYDDQYLMTIANPANSGAEMPAHDEDSVAAVIRSCGGFAAAAVPQPCRVVKPAPRMGRRRAAHGSLGFRVESRRISDDARCARRDRARSRHQPLPRRQVSTGLWAENRRTGIPPRLPPR